MNKVPKIDSGCATYPVPYYSKSGDRIIDLAGAILRHADKPKDYSDIIVLWAKEIIYQCGLINYLANEEKLLDGEEMGSNN